MGRSNIVLPHAEASCASAIVVTHAVAFVGARKLFSRELGLLAPPLIVVFLMKEEVSRGPLSLSFAD